MRKFLIVLSIIVIVPLAIALIGNPFGAYLCAYISTALIMFAVYDVARKMRRRESLKLSLIVGSAGIITGLFMNMSTLVGPSLYLAFLAGQALTVALVIWLYRTFARLSPSPA